MIPFILTISLGFMSFLASAFVILRIVIPILPPHPLSRRVAPSEFGLPNYNFRSLTSADKSHLWLASLDLLALSIFIWQAASEYSGGTTGIFYAKDATAAARLWFALTIRQGCLFVVSGLTLIHIRMGRSVSFGRKHWMIWAPTLLLGLASTTLAAIFASAGIPSLFAGIIAYSTIIVVLSTIAFGGLVYTLIVIKRNLAALNEPADTWPPLKEVEEKRRPFATEDVDGLREGCSWLTSDAGSSRHESISNWSFSTHHTCQGSRHSPAASHPYSQSKSVHWSNPAALGSDPSIPPVPPLPSVYRSDVPSARGTSDDPDPFRRDMPSRPRLGSQSSWLSSPSVSQATLSAWSYSTTPITGSVADANATFLPQAVPSRPVTPMASVVDLNATLLPQTGNSRLATPLASANVLGGYGYTADAEKGIASLAVNGGEIEISYSRYVFWLLSIWVPFTLSLPYLVTFATSGSVPKEVLPIMLVLSVTVSSPLLALNILIRSPIPIPTGLFDVHAEPPSVIMRAPSPSDTLATYCREYKTSGSVTVVEGRRSGDVWISQGDAVGRKGKLGRALGLMTLVPRLAVLPPEEGQDGEITPPLPMQEDTFNNSMTPARQSINSVELGRLCTESKASSHFSGDEAFATRIMIAQRHYSAVATTVVVPASPEKARMPDGLLGVATGIDVAPPVTPTVLSHRRSRSVPSILNQAVSTPDISAPPCQPLPPTPPNIRNAKQTAKQLLHRKSRSSDCSFNAVFGDDIKEIDALTAGVLPLLVPGLTLGEDIKIRDWEEFTPPLSSTVTKKMSRVAQKSSAGPEFGVLSRDGLNASLQCHSTPMQEKKDHRLGGNRVSTVSGSTHKSSCLSLSSPKDVVNTLTDNVDQECATGQYTASGADRHNTLGDEVASPVVTVSLTNQGQRHVLGDGALGCSASGHNVGPRIEVPDPTNTVRTLLTTLIPPSATSTATLSDVEGTFQPFAQSTPYDARKGNPYPRKLQGAGAGQTTSSRRSSIVYITSEGRLSELVTSESPDTSLPSVVKPLVRKANMLLPKLSPPDGPITINGGLRPLSLLKDRNPNTSKVTASGTRPLILEKKQKAKSRHKADENHDPSAAGEYLKSTRPLGRSDSSKLREKLRRNEVLPTVVIRPPSSNAKTGCPYETR